MAMYKKIPVFLLALCMINTPAHAVYTPLVEAGFLDGVKLDMTTAASGILALVVIVMGVRWLINMFR